MSMADQLAAMGNNQRLCRKAVSTINNYEELQYIMLEYVHDVTNIKLVLC